MSDKIEDILGPDEGLREDLARTPIETHKYGGKRHLTLDSIDQILAKIETDAVSYTRGVVDGMAKKDTEILRLLGNYDCSQFKGYAGISDAMAKYVAIEVITNLMQTLKEKGDG